MPPVYEQAMADGAAARRSGEPRDPAPYLPRYGHWKGARTPAELWLMGWDDEDERQAVEEARPRFVGEVEWRPVRRRRDG